MTYTLQDVNEESQGIYAVEMVPTAVGLETRPEGDGKDEVALVILRTCLTYTTYITYSCILMHFLLFQLLHLRF